MLFLGRRWTDLETDSVDRSLVRSFEKFRKNDAGAAIPVFFALAIDSDVFASDGFELSRPLVMLLFLIAISLAKLA